MQILIYTDKTGKQSLIKTFSNTSLKQRELRCLAFSLGILCICLLFLTPKISLKLLANFTKILHSIKRYERHIGKSGEQQYCIFTEEWQRSAQLHSAQPWQHQKGSASQTVGGVFLPGQAVHMHQNIRHVNFFLSASSPSKRGYEPGRSSEHCPGRPHAQWPWEGTSNKVVYGERQEGVKEGGGMETALQGYLQELQLLD